MRYEEALEGFGDGSPAWRELAVLAREIDRHRGAVVEESRRLAERLCAFAALVEDGRVGSCPEVGRMGAIVEHAVAYEVAVAHFSRMLAAVGGSGDVARFGDLLRSG